MNRTPITSKIIHCKCGVQYIGRAESILEEGTYIVIIKPDNSLAIHNSTNIIPVNYMGPKSIINIDGNEIIATKKKEKIIIKIDTIYNQIDIKDLSNHKLQIIHTEKDLVNKLINNISDYINDNIVKVSTEYETPLGLIDVLVESESYYHIIEMKRKKIVIKDINQIMRYTEQSYQKPQKGYIAGPEIAQNALEYANSHNISYIKIDFDRSVYTPTSKPS